MRTFIRCCSPSGPSAEKNPSHLREGAVTHRQHSSTEVVPARTPNGEHLVRSCCAAPQLRTASQQLFPDFKLLTVPLGDAESAFLMLVVTSQSGIKLEGSDMRTMCCLLQLET